MSPADSGADAGPGHGGRVELEELRLRVAQLEARGAAPHREHRVRATGSAVLIVLSAVLSLLAVVAVWAHDQVSDTNRFVATMAPLASDPQVQDAVTTRVTNVVVQQIDVPALVSQLSSAASQKGVPPKPANLIGRSAARSAAASPAWWARS